MSKVIFCGYGKLGYNCLEVLKEQGYEISYILTHKDLDEFSVDCFAISNNIEFTYKDIRNNLIEYTKILSELEAEYLISVNYRYILPKELLKISKNTFNIHGSALPKYRGRTPHVWSIINGETKGGITSHLIDETVDTGDIIVQKIIDIDIEDTGFTLLKKYEELYPKILLETLDRICDDSNLVKQKEVEASYYGKRIPEMGYIDFNKWGKEIHNFVRAQAFPYPGAYSYLPNGKKIIINKIKMNSEVDIERDIGIIVKLQNKYYVKCKDMVLEILEYYID